MLRYALFFLLCLATTAVAVETQVLGGTPTSGNLRIDVAGNGEASYLVFRYDGSSWVSQQYGKDSTIRLIADGGGVVVGGFGRGNGDQIGAPAVSNTKVGDTVTTTYERGGFRIVQRLTYRDGQPSYRMIVEITNLGASARSNLRFIAGKDTLMGGDDKGGGFWDAANRTIGVRRKAGGSEIRMALQGITPIDAYQSNSYSNVSSSMSAGALSNAIDPNEATDNGYGAQWNRASLAPGATWTIEAYERFTNAPAGDLSVFAPVNAKAAVGQSTVIEFQVTNNSASNRTPRLVATLNPTRSWNPTILSPSAGTSLAPGASFTARVQVTPPVGTTPGTNSSLRLTANDRSDGSGTDSSDACLVEIPNQVPRLITAIPDQGATEDTAFTFTFDSGTFADPDGTALTYTASKADGTALPAWLTFSPSLRRFTGTPTNAEVGTVNLQVNASDGFEVVSDTFSITVANTNDAPVLAIPIPAQKATSGSAYSYTFPSGTFTDADGTTLTYTAIAKPAWLSFNAGTRTFSGTPAPADVGSTTVVLQASDGTAIAFDAFGLTVGAAANQAPAVASAIADRTATEDASFLFTLPAGTFRDPDAGTNLAISAALPGGGALPAWLSFSNGVFAGTPGNGDVGTLTVRVTASDGTASVSDDFVITVANTNDPPVLAAVIADQTASEDAAFTYAVPSGTFSDPDAGTTLTWSARRADGSALPAWLSFNATAHTFTGTPGNGDIGLLVIEVTAGDGQASAAGKFSLTVLNTNDPPAVGAAIASPQNATEDQPFSFTVDSGAFTDSDAGDSLAYSASGLPAWLAFNGTTRTFSGTPANADVTAGVVITVIATDSGGATAQQTYTLVVANVNDPVVLAHQIPDQIAFELSPFSYQFPVDTFADPDATDVLTYTVLTKPAWLTFTAGTRTFSATPALGEVGGVVVVQAADASTTATAQFTITVGNTNQPPVVANAIADQNATEDAAFVFTLPANTFSDANPGTNLALSASGLPGWLAFNAATGVFSGTPRNADVGTASITVTASDGVASVGDTFTVTIANTNDAPTVAVPIPDQNAFQGSAFSFQFAGGAFADVDAGDSLSYAAVLADGGALPAWLTFTPATRTFSGTPANTDVRVLSIDVTATDVSSAAITDRFRLTVGDANDAPVNVQVIPGQSATEDQPFVFTVDSATFSDPDVGDVLTWSCTAKPGWLTFHPATRTFSGVPTNADVTAGTLVTVQVSDQGAATASASFNLAVLNTNDAPAAVAPLPGVSVARNAAIAPITFVAVALSSGGGAVFVDPDVGDTHTWSATGLPNGLSMAPADGTISGTPAVAPGAYPVTVTVTDSATPAATGSSSFVLTVTPGGANNPPILTGTITSDQTVQQDQAFSLTLPGNLFTDADSTPVLYSAVQLTPGEAALPSWLTFTSNTLTFAGTPGNAEVGVYSIRIKGTDGLATAVDEFTITVQNVNDAPTVAAHLLDRTFVVGTAGTVSLTGVFTDIDAGDSLTLSLINPLPAWLTFSQTQIAGTPPAGSEGFIAVDILATDTQSGTASDHFRIEVVTNLNTAPTVANPIPGQTAVEDVPWAFTFDSLTFSDADPGNVLTYSAGTTGGGPLPGWLTFSAAGRRFSGTPANAQVGSQLIVVTASDGRGGTASANFTINVLNTNDPPISVAPLANATATVYTATSITIPAAAFSDPDGDPLVLGAQAPAWLSFDPVSGVLSGTPPAVGTYSITATATDPSSRSAQASFSLVVSPPSPPSLSTIADQEAFSGQSFSFAIPANAATSIPGVTLTWRAGSMPAWLSFNAATATFSGTPGNQHRGPQLVAVYVNDGYFGEVGPLTFTITVRGRATIAVAGLDRLADGSTKPVSVTIDPATVPYSVTYESTSHPLSTSAPSAEGSYTVRVHVTDASWSGTPDAVHTLVIRGPYSYTVREDGTSCGAGSSLVGLVGVLLAATMLRRPRRILPVLLLTCMAAGVMQAEEAPVQAPPDATQPVAPADGPETPAGSLPAAAQADAPADSRSPVALRLFVALGPDGDVSRSPKQAGVDRADDTWGRETQVGILACRSWDIDAVQGWEAALGLVWRHSSGEFDHEQTGARLYHSDHTLAALTAEAHAGWWRRLSDWKLGAGGFAAYGPAWDRISASTTDIPYGDSPQSDRNTVAGTYAAYGLRLSAIWTRGPWEAGIDARWQWASTTVDYELTGPNGVTGELEVVFDGPAIGLLLGYRL